jgi:hypothetical protein
MYVLSNRPFAVGTSKRQSQVGSARKKITVKLYVPAGP